MRAGLGKSLVFFLLFFPLFLGEGGFTVDGPAVPLIWVGVVYDMSA